MKLYCNICGKPISIEVPYGTIVKAAIECPECLEKEVSRPDDSPFVQMDYAELEKIPQEQLRVIKGGNRFTLLENTLLREYCSLKGAIIKYLKAEMAFKEEDERGVCGHVWKDLEIKVIDARGELMKALKES